ncbi:hypothetical protein HD806DRAFT_48083 [Xylariaceae sp. AK1471]|nr:hypothetical protein HD806DRAFT_48083 [Xylariaceae sp. AK1471]
MASGGNESDDYLPDSDDSNDEDERPNRWTGPPSTWQQLNSAEIDTLTALNEIRNQDLSVHLYDAFALKHRHDKGETQGARLAKPVPNKDINIVTGQLVREDKWVPPKSWKAWPLPAQTVPHPEFMKRTDDADEQFTFRKQGPYVPSTELEETISATMLRFAKEKFQARQLAQRGADTIRSGPECSDEDSVTETGSAPSRLKSRSISRSRPVKYESTSEGERMDIDVDDSSVKKRSSNIPSEKPLLRPVVATDDELSYTLLRPSARQILAKLDTALVILHNAQESRINCSSDSDASDASSRSLSRSRSISRGPSRDRSRPPDTRSRGVSKSREPSKAREPAPPEAPVEGKKRVGRPRKVYPQLDGETDKAYAIRIARLRKQPIPTFPEDDPEPMSDSTPAPDSKSKGKGRARARSRARRARTQSRTPRETSEVLSDATSIGEKPLGKKIHGRTRLRDWRDILGAAALAGFPAPALDRAARRCADLFGQSFALHTLEEDQTKPDKRVRYDPGVMVVPSDSEEDGDDEGPSQQRRTSRAASTATTFEQGEQQRRGRSTSVVPRRSRSQSRSRSASAGGIHFCIVSNCVRAVDPFTRRANLIRHLKLVHHYDGNELPVEVDSEDEMHGAVHVDGFLKPIKMRRGWRGDDVSKEKEMRRPRRSRRERDVRVEERMNQRMRDAGSATGHEVSD